MMSSFFENSAAAGTEFQESQAQKPMLNEGEGLAGASDIYAPPSLTAVPPPNPSEPAPVITLSQLEGVVANLATASVEVNEQNMGVNDLYAPQPIPMVYQSEVGFSDPNPMVYQPEVVVSALEVNPTFVSNDQNNKEGLPIVFNDPNQNNNNNNNVVVNESTILVNDPNLDGNNYEVVNYQNNDNYNNNVAGNDSFTLKEENNDNKVVLNDENDNYNNNVVGNDSPTLKEENNDNKVVTPSGFVNNQSNGMANNINGVVGMNSGEGMKRKRGRPRKVPLTEGSSVVHVSSMTTMQSSGTTVANHVEGVQGCSEKKGRGRPAGSAKKHKADAPFPVSPPISGSAGVGFVPYVITVRSGENILPRLLSLLQVDTQVVCVLTASGTISNVTLQQPSSPGGTVTFQGHNEILSLSGSFLLSKSGGQRSTTGGLSVSLAMPYGRIIGGGVAGVITAGSDVQIIVGTFLASQQHLTGPSCNAVFTTPLKHVSSVGGSPPPYVPSPYVPSSEFSGGPGSPFNHSSGGYNINNQQQNASNFPWM